MVYNGDMMQVLVNLPEDTYRRARRLAQLTRRDVADVLADTLDLSLPSLGDSAEPALAQMKDDQVLALAELHLSDEEDERLSDLLDSQQAGTLSDAERPELARLMQRYQEGVLLKAEALAEGVRRGLIPHLWLDPLRQSYSHCFATKQRAGRQRAAGVGASRMASA